MKKLLAFLLSIILMMTILCSCGNNISGKYKSMWNEKEYYSFQNGNYTTADSDDNGTFVNDGNSVVLTNKKHKSTFTIQENYLLSIPYKGVIPDTNFFNVVCTDEDSTVTMQFNIDGTFNRTVNLFDNNVSTFKGIYTRNKEIITIIFDSGDKCKLLVKDNLLYEAYIKE